jgi:hypothetical protein
MFKYKIFIYEKYLDLKFIQLIQIPNLFKFEN